MGVGVLALLFLLGFGQASAQEAVAPPEGTWRGRLEIGSEVQDALLRLRPQDGGFGGTLDVPGQDAAPLPLSRVEYDAPQLVLTLLEGAAVVELRGEVAGPRYCGSLRQGERTGRFAFERLGPADVDLEAGRYELAVEVPALPGGRQGRLTLPVGPGPHPAVLLIGAVEGGDIDGTTCGFALLKTLAQTLAESGIAALRCAPPADRGDAPRGGEELLEAHSASAAAALHYLRGRSDVDGGQIGIAALHDAALVAPRVFARTEDVSFVVLFAPPAAPGSAALRERELRLARAQGMPEDEVPTLQWRIDLLFRAVRTGEGWEEARRAWIDAARRRLEAMPGDVQALVGDREQYLQAAADEELATWRRPWRAHRLSSAPAAELAEIDAPVLALFGGRDPETPPKLHAGALTAAAERADRGELTCAVIPGANHLFQPAVSGQPFEYALLPHALSPEFAARLLSWLRRRVVLPGER